MPTGARSSYSGSTALDCLSTAPYSAGSVSTAASAPTGTLPACPSPTAASEAALATGTAAPAARLRSAIATDRGAPSSTLGTTCVVANRSIHAWPRTGELPPVEVEKRPRSAREDEEEIVNIAGPANGAGLGRPSLIATRSRHRAGTHQLAGLAVQPNLDVSAATRGSDPRIE